MDGFYESNNYLSEPIFPDENIDLPEDDYLPDHESCPPIIFNGEESSQNDYGSESSSSPEVFVATCTNNDAYVKTTVSNLRTVLATRTKFNGGRLASYLSNIRGCIILPLRGLSLIREPTGHHLKDPTVVVYQPMDYQTAELEEIANPILKTIMDNIE